jgi:hypothetical protein
MSLVPRHFGVVALLGALLLGWVTGDRASGSADPNGTADTRAALCAVADECLPMVDGVRMHWVSRTGNGDLYLMVRADCRGPDLCGAWFVERTPRGMAARLNIAGRFRVIASGKAVPDVQAWRTLSENEFEVTRYTWAGGAFQRVETRTVYTVDGEECGSALDCYQKAQDAHRERHTDKALRIWEKVHSVSFI